MYQPPEVAISEAVQDIIDHASSIRAVLTLMNIGMGFCYQDLRQAIGTDWAHSLKTSTQVAIKLVDSLEEAVAKIDTTLVADEHHQN